LLNCSVGIIVSSMIGMVRVRDISSCWCSVLVLFCVVGVGLVFCVFDWVIVGSVVL